MNHFRRSVFRIFFTMFFLLLVAWVCMKLMQYRGNWGGLLDEIKGWFGGRIGEAIQSAMDSIRPKTEELIQSIQSFFNGNVTLQ